MSGWRNRARVERATDAAQADLRLINAYRSLFATGREDAEMVLADLAAFCGFYQVEAGGADGAELNHHAGRRAAFGRIFNFLSLSDEQLAAMEQASRDEASALGE